MEICTLTVTGNEEADFQAYNNLVFRCGSDAWKRNPHGKFQKIYLMEINGGVSEGFQRKVNESRLFPNHHSEFLGPSSIILKVFR